MSSKASSTLLVSSAEAQPNKIQRTDEMKNTDANDTNQSNVLLQTVVASTELIEDEATAREKLEEAKYDPDNVSETTFMKTMKRKRTGPDIKTPLIHFCWTEDMQMVRYLHYKRGASTTASTPKGYFFPLFMACLQGNFELCKWLYEHGAEKDIQRITRGHAPRTPLKVAKGPALVHWLILKGAVCSNVASGEIDREVLRRDLKPIYPREGWDERPRLLEWARSYVQTHHNFMVFLGGTLSDNDSGERILGENDQQEDNRSPLQSLRGTPGVLELIADYVGFGRSKRDLRLMRGFAAELEEFLKDVPSSV